MKNFMIINDRDGWIFVHNPKCAGSTVRKALMKYETRNNFYWFFDEFDGAKIDKAHLPLMVLYRYSRPDFDLFSEYKVFGFVRNPYTRAVSAYNETHQRIYRDFVSGELSLNDYRKSISDFIVNLKEGVLNGLNFEYRHFLRQIDFFYFNGKCLADHIANIEKVDVQSSRFTLIGGGVEDLPKILQFKENEKSIGAKFNEVLNEEAISVINTIYEDDFCAFGYRKL